MKKVGIKDFRGDLASYLGNLPVTLTRWGRPIAVVREPNGESADKSVQVEEMESDAVVEKEYTSSKKEENDVQALEEKKSGHKTFYGVCSRCGKRGELGKAEVEIVDTGGEKKMNLCEKCYKRGEKNDSVEVRWV